MLQEQTRRKAIALMSGGLDSTLAAKIIKDQGIEVVGLHLLSPFGCKEDVQRCSDAVGIPLLVKEKGAAYLDLVENPRYGYGRNMNPCIDCRIFMFQLADVVCRDEGADFIVTGEVLGQRPMSQQRNSLALIDSKSPLKGKILRPLSAHCLEPTIPEEQGWVDRQALFQISGRARKVQLELAEKLGISGFSSPGGGCLLTESQFSTRLKDFFGHKTYRNDSERLAQSEMLRYGRHFRFSEKTKVILSRNERENAELERLFGAANGIFFSPDNFNGPNAVAFGVVEDEQRRSIGGLIARYGKSDPSSPRRIRYREGGETDCFVVDHIPTEEAIEALRIQ